jgi:hypothetical protein
MFFSAGAPVTWLRQPPERCQSGKSAGILYNFAADAARWLAIEMVPAALKQLEIPRPADPTDPYSYSSGVPRLKEKTLTLSPPTQEALDRLREE